MKDENLIAEALGKITWALMSLFCVPLLCAFFGGLGGALAGLFYSDDILPILQGMGLSPDITLWQLGVVLGFFKAYIHGHGPH